MKVINSGSTEIKFITQGKVIVLKKSETAEIDEHTFSVLHKIFPALEASFEGAIIEKDTIIEAEAQPIETKKKGTKNGTRKKSK